MKKVFDEEFHEKYYLQVGSYYNSNRLAITVCKDNDEYVEDITVNQPLVELKDDNQILLSNHISNGVKYYFDRVNLHRKIRIVNRLDKDTSGIVIFAKNEYVQENLIRQMGDGFFKKEYLGIVNRSFTKKFWCN